jgi:prephenate dehydrogenase
VAVPGRGEHGFKKISIVGVGLMGGSLAMALMCNPGVEEVIGYDLSLKTRKRARELGICDRVTDTAGEAAAVCDLLVLAVPVGAMVRAFGGAAELLREGTVVTDFGSAKLKLTAAIEEAAPPGIHYVGGHPMTGSEQSGVESARSDLYRNCYYILTPTRETDVDSFRRLHTLLGELGARVISMDPESHDRAMATISHVPHLLSLLLMDMADRQREKMKNLFTIAAGGFRDMTRIAASSPELWIDVCMENREFIVDRLLEYGIGITELAEILDTGDRARLRKKFERARHARTEMSVKAGLEIEELFEVTLPVPDEPGVISRISTAVGAIGINIEDISITHPLEGETGILSLDVLGEENARRVADELISLGFLAAVRKP